MGTINRDSLALAGSIAVLLSAFAMAAVGTFLSPFYAGYFTRHFSLPALPTVSAFIALHWFPLILLLKTFLRGTSVPRWWGVVHVAASLLPLYVGWEGLIMRRDFGDTILWLPYLLAGIASAIVGIAIAARRSAGDPA